jgi:hypothetical protein
MLREDAIQKAVFQHLRTRGRPGIVAFHPKNGGIHQRGRRRGINAGQGVVSGACDVIVIAPPNGRMSSARVVKPVSPTVSMRRCNGLRPARCSRANVSRET